MAKEKWLIDLSEMDEFQRQILELSTEDSYLIRGCAGSGKTILALRRAHDIKIKSIAEKKPVSFTLLVYTKALRSFIKSGVLELGLDLNQVVHYDVWDESAVDYIVVDEVQDFDKEKIEAVRNAANISMMLYGDSHQQVYHGKMSTEEIADFLKLPQKELLRNYRLPKTIASFVSHVSDDLLLENKCVKLGTEKPRIIKFATWQQELDFIMNEIRTRNLTDTAILLPYNTKSAANYVPRNVHRNVESVSEYLDSQGFSHEFKMRDDNDWDRSDLDFDSELPKVLTWHSAKGLQFEAVFMPFCEYPYHDDWFVENYKKPLYVGLTRSYKHLYLTHSGNVSPFFKKIPPFKYDN
ncbi:RNA helicase [Chitinophaga eiseniae]|uniref:DNA 3'-5' helicase II n=1 Tax=Chitinophaga eiseniae TaxID=634771 RepID=A0A1T4QZX2_9BACT|nr:3'-5' exonuclease [Chitinophaga eiseniae]SKA09274.1 RNA helicase [Chitinophaga eiseniae]